MNFNKTTIDEALAATTTRGPQQSDFALVHEPVHQPRATFKEIGWL